MFASSFQQFNLVNVLAQKGGGGPQGGPTAADPEYKALVCIFMFGGNDPNNTIVPIGTNTVLPNTNYSDYSAGASRACDSRSESAADSALDRAARRHNIRS